METEKMVKQSAIWTAERLAAFNKGRASHQQMIRVINPNAQIKERFISRRNFEKVFKKEGWFEIGAGEDIAQHLMKNREKTPAELVLEAENERLKEEMARLRNGSTSTPAPASEPTPPPTFSLPTTPPDPVDFDLTRNAIDIATDLETIDRVAVLNEILAAEKGGQDRAGVKQSIIKRITELS